MKKITYEQACKLLTEGKNVRCRINSRETISIKNRSDLDTKRNLYIEGIQGFDLFEDEKHVNVSKNAYDLTIDEAYELLANHEIIYCKIDDEEEKVTNPTELSNLIRRFRVRNEEPLIYWYV